MKRRLRFTPSTDYARKVIAFFGDEEGRICEQGNATFLVIQTRYDLARFRLPLREEVLQSEMEFMLMPKGSGVDRITRLEWCDEIFAWATSGGEE